MCNTCIACVHILVVGRACRNSVSLHVHTVHTTIQWYTTNTHHTHRTLPSPSSTSTLSSFNKYKLFPPIYTAFKVWRTEHIRELCAGWCRRCEVLMVAWRWLWARTTTFGNVCRHANIMVGIGVASWWMCVCVCVSECTWNVGAWFALARRQQRRKNPPTSRMIFKYYKKTYTNTPMCIFFRTFGFRAVLICLSTCSHAWHELLRIFRNERRHKTTSRERDALNLERICRALI